MSEVQKEKYTCPCCGYRTLEEPSGNYEICPVCFWEDDPIQAKDPDYTGGANTMSLREAQNNFVKFRAKDEVSIKDVRKPLPGEKRDSSWEFLG